DRINKSCGRLLYSCFRFNTSSFGINTSCNSFDTSSFRTKYQEQEVVFQKVVHQKVFVLFSCFFERSGLFSYFKKKEAEINQPLFSLSICSKSLCQRNSLKTNNLNIAIRFYVICNALFVIFNKVLVKQRFFVI